MASFLLPTKQTIAVPPDASGRVVDGPGGGEIVYDSYQQVTTGTGQLVFSDLPLGEYSYNVRADGYYLETGLIEVLPIAPAGEEDAQASAPGVLASPLRLGDGGGDGGGNSRSVPLEKDPFAYEWTVFETDPIEDIYDLSVEITYEAEVPEPALFVSPIIGRIERLGGRDEKS